MKQPIIFGEALFDIFPGEKKVLGGAPFNVTWNLSAFGAKPFFISRVGDDQLGQAILNRMQQAGMDTSGVQIDTSYPTGTVSIEMSGSTHQFNINADQAYDHIDGKQAIRDIADRDIGLLYFGTLAIRDEDSRDAMKQLLRLDAPVFVDINLRAPWWTRESIAVALDKATWVKINDEELDIIIKELYAMELPQEEAIEYLYATLSLEILIVTCGEKGAYIRDPKQLYFQQSPVVETLKDTVGAGDAFSSVVILGLLNDWSPETILQRALGFAAEVCTIQGAVSDDTSFYHNASNTWKTL